MRSNGSKNELVNDLLASEWLCEKVQRVDYAKKLYAALCNTQWIKNEVWDILKDEYSAYSWRTSGGIIAEMLNEGDYMDWYCSGSEGVIDPEIAEDLAKLGWYGRSWPDPY